jgi:LysR family transcriptional regulator, benzoate and cis,cis-muconate-responsive activator of ben and cat genes
MLVTKKSFRLPTIRQLQCFLAVAEELSFRQAADRLNMSQPPLTRQIQNLENLLGAPLFARDTHSVSLTPQGRALCDAIGPLLVELGNVIDRICSTRDEPNLLRLGVTTVVDPSIFPRFDQALAAQGLNIKVDVERLLCRRLIDLLDTKQIDLALIGNLNLVPETIVLEDLYSEPFMLAISSAHPVARKRSVTFDDIRDLPLFWFHRSGCPQFFDYCESYFASAGYAPERLPEPEDLHVLLSLVAQGQGVALAPKSLQIVTRQGVTYAPFEPEIARRLYVTIALARRAGENSNTVLAAARIIADAVRVVGAKREAGGVLQ